MKDAEDMKDTEDMKNMGSIDEKNTLADVETDVPGTSKALLDFIKRTPTAFHAAENVIKRLEETGHTRFPSTLEGTLLPGGKYYVPVSDTAVFAFRLPEKSPEGLFVCAAHGDSPCFRLKACGETFGVYERLPVERYGGMILSSWLDRPLGVAGRVCYKDGDGIARKNVILPGKTVIPNVAIHLNRKINDGYVYNVATDMLPLYSGVSGTLKKRLSAAAGCDESTILDFDLFLYCDEDGFTFGVDDEFVSAPRLDDLQCVFACLEGYLDAVNSPDSSECGKVSMFALYDSEEVGSRAITGADSIVLTEIVRKIAETYGLPLLSLTSNGRLFSADNAHGLHPNHPEMSDTYERPVPNGGVVIKYSPQRSYITDGRTSAELRLLCENNGIKYQVFSNRADSAGGSTLGNIAQTSLPIEGVDVGLAQLAMHSAFETAGARDTLEMRRLAKFFLR